MSTNRVDWESLGVDAEKIALVLHEVSQGDTRKLKSRDTDKPDGIWGNAIAKLFPNKLGTKQDRGFLCVIWDDNRKGVKDEYYKISGRQRTTTYVESKQRNDSNCICEKLERKLPRERRILCNQCKKNLHYSCAEITDGDDLTDFVCGYCSGDLQIAPMLNESLNIDNKPIEKQKAYECGSDDDNGVRVSTDDEAMRTDSDTSCSESARNKIVSDSADSASNHSNSNRGFDSSPSPSFSPFSVLGSSGRRSSLSRRRKSLSSSSRPRSSSLQSRNSVNDVFETQAMNSSLQDISDEEDWDSPKPEENKRKRSPGCSTSLINDTEKRTASRSPVKKGPKVCSLENYDAFSSLTADELSSIDSNSDEETRTIDSDDDDFKEDKKKARRPLISARQWSKDKNKPTNTKNWNNHSEDEEEKSAKPTRRPRKTDNPNFDRGEKFDTSKVPKEFTLSIPFDEWRKILIQKRNTTGNFKDDFVLAKGYMGVIRKHFWKVNKYCIPTNLNSSVNGPFPDRESQSFVRIRGKCNREPCETTWTFKVTRKPSENRDVRMKVSCDGEILHFENLSGKLKWMGEKQSEGREMVADCLPYTARTRLFANADPELLDAGNFADLPSALAIQQMRTKKLAEHDFAKDVYKDCAFAKREFRETFPDEKLPGYIIKQRSEKTKFICYTMKQMNILSTLQNQQQEVYLQIDATGGLVRSLPFPYDDGTLLLYTIILRSSGGISMPLTEMITTSNTTESVYKWINEYFLRFEQLFKKNLPFYGITKIEMDFSSVLISATVKTFADCKLDEYLVNIWNCMTGSKVVRNQLFPVHVCRVHVMRAIKDKLKKEYLSTGKTDEFKAMMLWAQRLLQGRTMVSFQRRLKDLGMLCGVQYKTDAVLSRIRNLCEPTDKNEKPLWNTVDVSKLSSLQFWRRSPFGSFAEVILDICKSYNDECIEKNVQFPENTFFSPNIAKYIKVYVAPFFPILSHCIFECCEINVVDDTTNPIENYHGILKNNIHKWARNQKASRFFRKQSEFILGRCKEIEYKLGIKSKSGEEEPKPQPEKEEDDSAVDASQDIYNESDHLNQEPDWNAADHRVTNAKKEKSYVSPQKEKEIFKKPIKRESTASTYLTFTSRIPVVRWGKIFVEDNNKIYLNNTCSMDSTLQLLVGLYQHHIPFAMFLSERKTCDPLAAAVEASILALVKDNDVNLAKTIWIRDVLKKDMHKKFKANVLDMEGCEETHGYGKLYKWMQLARYSMCANENCGMYVNPDAPGWKSSEHTSFEIVDISRDVHFFPDDVLASLNGTTKDLSSHCSKCGKRRMKKYTNRGIPMLFFYPLLSNIDQSFSEAELKLTQQIFGQTYKVFGYTVIRGKVETKIDKNGKEHKKYASLPHFLTVFVHDKKRIYFDGLKDFPSTSNASDDLKVTSVWLVPCLN